MYAGLVNHSSASRWTGFGAGRSKWAGAGSGLRCLGRSPVRRLASSSRVFPRHAWQRTPAAFPGWSSTAWEKRSFWKLLRSASFRRTRIDNILLSLVPPERVVGVTRLPRIPRFVREDKLRDHMVIVDALNAELVVPRSPTSSSSLLEQPG